MDIFAAIIEWAATLPVWEQDAVRRLIMNGEITDQDEEELIALIKSEDPTQVDLPAVPDPQPVSATAVSLISLEHICGVNALAPGQVLTFNHPNGLTVIYGDNGSGKSGYSRILKHACRTREAKPPIILSDVYCCTTPVDAQARFSYEVDATEYTEDWKVGATSSEALASIALFDSSCCRLYVEKDGDIVYRPYGLEVFDQLGGTCKSVKAKLIKESDAIQVTAPAEPYSHPAVANAVSALLSDNSKENITELSSLAVVSERDRARATALQTKITQLATDDPQRLAGHRRSLADRLEQTVLKVSTAQSTMLEPLADLPEAFVKRGETADLAKKASLVAFGEEPVGGVGGHQWKKMFEFAMAFSTEVAYPDKPVPYIGPESRCVLCQQLLDEQARGRLARFAEFIGNKSEEAARAADGHYQRLRATVIDLGTGIAAIDDALIEQIAERSESSAAELRSIRTAFVTLSKAAEEADTPEKWAALNSPVASTKELTSLIAELRAEATELEKNSNVDELARLKLDLELLTDRIRLAKTVSAIVDTAAVAARKRRLKSLADDVDTEPITRQGGAITDKVLTKALCGALNSELKALDAQSLGVEFARKGSDGGQLHYLRLTKAPRGTKVQDVLSEGEHRCLGIAAFVAELDQAGHSSAIVLDDPVSSLDHKHRDAVAKRLVREAKSRQVVIFTHDLAFLYELDRAATELHVPLLPHTVDRTSEGTGVPVLTGVYPETLPVKKLIKHIRAQAEAAAAVDELDPTRRGRVVDCHGLIRAGYERVVEEVLLQMVVRPFDKAVHTQKLKGVEVHGADHQKVHLAVTKCSEIIDAHRTPAGSGTTRLPSNDELMADVQALEAFRGTAENQAAAARERRKKLEHPPTS